MLSIFLILGLEPRKIKMQKSKIKCFSTRLIYQIKLFQGKQTVMQCKPPNMTMTPWLCCQNWSVGFNRLKLIKIQRRKDKSEGPTVWSKTYDKNLTIHEKNIHASQPSYVLTDVIACDILDPTFLPNKKE
jgi:hypothetical protein